MEKIMCDIQCLDGLLSIEIPMAQMSTSTILNAMIIDIGIEPGESFPIPCFTELTQQETQSFIQAWLETIPNTGCTNYTRPPEYTINSHPVICPVLETAIQAGTTWLDHLAKHNLSGPTIQKYDMLLIGKYTKPANFLDLQALLSVFKFILAKQYREMTAAKTINNK